MTDISSGIKINIVKRIAELFILLQILTIFLSVLFVTYIPTSSFGVGFREAFTSRFTDYTYDSAGKIAGDLSIIIILALPFLISIYLRNKIILFLAQLCLVLLIFRYISLGKTPYIPLFFFIVSLLASFRENYRAKQKYK